MSRVLERTTRPHQVPGGVQAAQLRMAVAQLVAEHYHQVSDEVRDVWNFEGLAADARLLLLAILEVANRDDAPEWKPGSEFSRSR